MVSVVNVVPEIVAPPRVVVYCSPVRPGGVGFPSELAGARKLVTEDEDLVSRIWYPAKFAVPFAGVAPMNVTSPGSRLNGLRSSTLTVTLKGIVAPPG